MYILSKYHSVLSNQATTVEHACLFSKKYKQKLKQKNNQQDKDIKRIRLHRK